VTDLRVAIIGYGLSGRFFHAPLITATAGLAVASVVTADPSRHRQVTADQPHAEAVASVQDLWNGPAPEIVVVATPNDSHVAIASESIVHGVPVVVDKPLALGPAEASALVARAEDAAVLLTVFQNRRWDTDQLTLRRLLAEGALGEIIRYESRFERWRPDLDRAKWRENVAPEQGGGVLLDLGSHLVDQALALFGPVTDIYAEVESRRGAPTDDDVFIALRHARGTVSHLYASAVAPAPGPRLRAQGTTAAFVVPALDPQEAALRAGARPDTLAGWGNPPDWERGRLVAGERSVPVPPEPGDWARFYALLRDAILAGGPPPVDPHDAVEALRVLDAARRAARDRSVVAL
jgi:predicted dehydrogenase